MMSRISTTVVLDPMEAPALWECYLCRLPGFPIPANLRAPLVKLLQDFSAAVSERESLNQCLLLQFLQIHHDRGSEMLEEHAPQWLPEFGLGVWPDRPPPKQFDQKSFYKFPPGYKQPVLLYQLIRINKDPDSARDLMLGRGVVQIMLGPLTEQQMLEAGHNVLLPPITESMFKAFPFHLPMLSGSTFEQATAEQLDQWSCGATVYIRESVEDKGLLIASREPLAPVFEALGGRLDEESGKWSIPVEIEEVQTG